MKWEKGGAYIESGGGGRAYTGCGGGVEYLVSEEGVGPI